MKDSTLDILRELLKPVDSKMVLIKDKLLNIFKENNIDHIKNNKQLISYLDALVRENILIKVYSVKCYNCKEKYFYENISQINSVLDKCNKCGEYIFYNELDPFKEIEFEYIKK